MNNGVSIYHTSWIISRVYRYNLLLGNRSETGKHFVFPVCSEVNSKYYSQPERDESIIHLCGILNVDKVTVIFQDRVGRRLIRYTLESTYFWHTMTESLRNRRVVLSWSQPSHMQTHPVDYTNSASDMRNMIWKKTNSYLKNSTLTSKRIFIQQVDIVSVYSC